MAPATLPAGFLLQVLHELPLGVLVLEPLRGPDGAVEDFRLVAANREAARRLQRRTDGLVGQRLLRAFPGARAAGLVARYVEAADSGFPARFEQHFPAAHSVTGMDRWYQIHVHPYDGRLVVVFEDVTLQRRYRDHIREIAFRDHLTGLHNRRWFLTRAPQLLALARREGWEVGLLVFDLDGFKPVNDTAGHAAGDRLLRELAQRLAGLHREEDILFRSGGDEFGLFLPRADLATATEIGGRIAAALAPPFEIAGRRHRVGVSIGVCVRPAAEADVDALLECADAAMYRAKRAKATRDEPLVVDPA